MKTLNQLSVIDIATLKQLVSRQANFYIKKEFNVAYLEKLYVKLCNIENVLNGFTPEDKEGTP